VSEPLRVEALRAGYGEAVAIAARSSIAPRAPTSSPMGRRWARI